MSHSNLELFEEIQWRPLSQSGKAFCDELAKFCEFGKATRIERKTNLTEKPIPVFINEFWTAKQRAASRLHEISYRACFKPQLPRFFIDRLTDPGDLVYDPMMGRGTTPLEADLCGRLPAGCDINPLSSLLLEPRLNPPEQKAVQARMEAIPLQWTQEIPEELLVFYHPETLREICALRHYLLERARKGKLDAIDSWIRMVATNRLTGHSNGFFSVYTLPPNQAVSVERQRKINEQRKQSPDRRSVPDLILKKSRSLLSNLTPEERAHLRELGPKATLLTQSCEATPKLKKNSVSLAVTSPPFLDTVDYPGDNWLRCWFNGIDEKSLPIWMFHKVPDWQNKMARILRELRRVLKPGGYVAFEVGEVRRGALQLEDVVIPAGQQSGLSPLLILINDQAFTKTSNCWGIENSTKGTNTNRVVLFQKVD